jgi:hypothetical protein
MIAPEELFQGIESDRFAALVNVASNLKTFLRALDAQPEVRQPAAAMGSAEVRSSVLGRVIELTERATDPNYEHPGDSALAAYLWLLGKIAPELASVAVAKVEECPRCWWAKKVAAAIKPAQSDGNGVRSAGAVSGIAPARSASRGRDGGTEP